MKEKKQAADGDPEVSQEQEQPTLKKSKAVDVLVRTRVPMPGGGFVKMDACRIDKPWPELLAHAEQYPALFKIFEVINE